MRSKKLEFGFKELGLSEEEICRIIGYSTSEEKVLLKQIIAELMELAGNICSIKAHYSVFEDVGFDHGKGFIDIGGVTFCTGRIIEGKMKKAESVAVFLCTAGEGAGNLSHQYMLEKDLLRGYVMDVIGSEIVEAAADKMQEELEGAFAVKGYKITNRYSPGYCGWDVSEQHKLFSLVPDNFCGIRLNESSLMDPVKSVSGIIGLGENVKRVQYSCQLCDMPNCIYMRKRKS